MSTKRRMNVIAATFVVIVSLSLSSVADDDGHDGHGVAFDEGHERLLTVDEIRTIVNLHNALRSSENASNMNYLKWDKELAGMASMWAQRCSYEHGSHADHHEDDNVTNFFGNIGHIVDVLKEVDDLAGAIREWHDQKQHFHYDSNSCDARHSCGKYTQVVWAKTQFVGCGLAFCKKLISYSGYEIKDVYSFICNYAPSGNMATKKPFAKGNPCSQCSSGLLTCFNGLCREDCQEDKISCTCEAQCDNCGKLELPSCRCLCTEGWMGPECSEPCRDKHVSCGSTPGWPAYTCKYVGHHEWDFVQSECPAMCQTCTISTSLPQCELNRCDPRNCHNGAIFDQEECRCICPKDYTGEYCRLPHSEHRVGVTLGIVGPIHKWTQIWRNLLLPLAEGINAFCRNVANYALCCDTMESQVKISKASQYVTEFNVFYGTDYPVLDPVDRKIYHLLIYATYWPDNTLCQTSNNMEMVPQKVILNTLKDSASLISQVIRRNCEDCAYLDVWPSHSMREMMSSTCSNRKLYTLRTVLAFVLVYAAV